MEARFLDESAANVGLPFPSPFPLERREIFLPLTTSKNINLTADSTANDSTAT
jgi:hypothetical protein